MINILFVCLGNICRSPTAEGVFRDMVEKRGYSHLIQTDSSGMGRWHIGNPPDMRSQTAARKRGIEIGDLRARQTTIHDFIEFEYIVAMDSQNMSDLKDICPPEHTDRLYMMLDFAKGVDISEVPDPYHGNNGFELVLDLIENASAGLLEHVIKTHI